MMLCTRRGDTEILSRTEPVESEFPGGIMAVQVINMAQPPQTAWIKVNVYKDEMAPPFQRRSTQSDNQEASYVTSVSQKPAGKITDHANKVADSSAHSMKHSFTEPSEESPLEGHQSLSEKESLDNRWNWSDEDYQLYETDQSEDMPPYWLDFEDVDSTADGNASTTCFSCSLAAEPLREISDHGTSVNPPDVQGLPSGTNENSNVTKTEEKIRSLKALLAEQERQISRLKNESKEKIFQSKGETCSIKTDYGCPSVTRLSENGTYFSMPNQRKLVITKDDNYHKERKTSVGACTRRRRSGRTENSDLSNTKRFRYHFRKDVLQEIKGYLAGKNDHIRTKDNSAFKFIKPDIRKAPFTQDEFLSFLRLARTTRLVLKE